MTAQGRSDYVGGLPAGCLLNEYQIERVLGHGGFGVTYLARDTMLQKVVAIKEYLPAEWAVRQAGNTVSVRSSEDRIAFEQGQTSFLNEARVLARFTHPNLIAVYRFFQANNTAYFVMEYAEGETLRTLIKRQRTLDEAQIMNLLLPVIQGLEGVHLAGIMHRDIKPENILVRKDHTAVLIDFGAARIATGSKSRATTSVLTAGYAPVEQYSTSGHQGPWTDIYALGAVMYHAISGRKPLDAIGRMADDALVPAALAGRGRYSASFLAAVDWALRVKGEERPKSLTEWRLTLEGSRPAPTFAMTPAAEGMETPETPNPTVKVAAPEPRAGPPPAKATAPAEVQAPTPRSSAPLWAAAAAFAIAGAGAAGWYFSRLAAPPAPERTEAAPAVAAPKIVAPAPGKPSDPAAAAQELGHQKALELRRLEAQKLEAERLAAEKRAQELLDQKKKAEAELQAKLEAERKRLAEEEAQRKAEAKATKEKKGKDDAPVGF